MKERIDDPIYEVLRSYDHLLLDYMVLGFHDLYQGEQSHKEAVIEAITGFGSMRSAAVSKLDQRAKAKLAELCRKEGVYDL